MNSATSTGHRDEVWEAPQLVWLSSQVRIAAGPYSGSIENDPGDGEPLSTAASGMN